MTLGLSSHVIEPEMLQALKLPLSRVKRLEVTDMKLAMPMVGLLELIARAEMLEFLDISNNLIKDPKEVELLADIAREKRLTHLNVDNCFVSSDAMEAIVAAIYRSKTLQAAHIGGNPAVEGIDEGTAVLSRYLGHREIDACHKFRQRKHCWICQKWRPVVVLAISKHRPTISGEGMDK